MSDDDPQRMHQIRKFSAIYGRFDCKRRPEKPLTLHEVSDIFLIISNKEICDSTNRICSGLSK